MIGGSCKIADLNRRRIALLESLERERFPFPGLDVIYVIQPEASSVDKIIADWDDDGEDPTTTYTSTSCRPAIKSCW